MFCLIYIRKKKMFRYLFHFFLKYICYNIFYEPEPKPWYMIFKHWLFSTLVETICNCQHRTRKIPPFFRHRWYSASWDKMPSSLHGGHAISIWSREKLIFIRKKKQYVFINSLHIVNWKYDIVDKINYTNHSWW